MQTPQISRVRSMPIDLSILQRNWRPMHIHMRGGYHRDFEFDPKGFGGSADYLSKQDKLFQCRLYCSKGKHSSEGGYYRKKKSWKICAWYSGIIFPTSPPYQAISDIYCDSLESKLFKNYLKPPEILRLKGFTIKFTPGKIKVFGIIHTIEMVSKALALGKNVLC